MKSPVSLSAVAVVSLVLLFAAIAVVGAQNLHASTALGGTGDDNTNPICTTAPTARPTRTPGHSAALGAVGTVHADPFISCDTPSPSPSPSPVPGAVTPRPTRTPVHT